MLKNNAIMITSSVIGLTLMGLCYMLYRKTVNIEKNLISHKHQIDELSRFMSSKSSWINENNIHQQINTRRENLEEYPNIETDEYTDSEGEYYEEESNEGSIQENNDEVEDENDNEDIKNINQDMSVNDETYIKGEKVNNQNIVNDENDNDDDNENSEIDTDNDVDDEINEENTSDTNLIESKDRNSNENSNKIMYTANKLRDFKKNELQEICKKLGVSSSGKRDDLISNILNVK